MYKITYNNGYVRYSIYQYGRYNAKRMPSDVVKSEEVVNEEDDCPSEHWLFNEG